MNARRKPPSSKAGSASIWELLEQRVERHENPADNLGLWEQISVQPGGLWSDVSDETMVGAVPLNKDDLWRDAAEETLILDRSALIDVWDTSQEDIEKTILPGMPQDDLWQEISDETLIIARPEVEVWSALPKIRDLQNFKPTRALGWAIKKLEDSKGEEYYVLKNLREGQYLRLNEQQFYLWNLMDGAHSVQDLAVANFLQYQTLSVEWLSGFLGQLNAKGFLVTDSVNVYRAAHAQLWRRGIDYWAKRAVGLLFRSELSFKSVDTFYGAMYKVFGWFFYLPPIVVLIWLISLAGIPAFVIITLRGEMSVIGGAAGVSMGIGLAGVLVSQIFAVFTHETAHALTTKHYGRTVRRGGMGLYFGLITFFMDTTDIWLEPRKHRLAVTWAGPLSGFFLGGITSLALIILGPRTPLAGVAFQFATFCMGISILNLNPLLKLDGYYMLLDWLEIPMLRERSIAFARKELLPKLRKRESFNREERIFSIFGILALIWTVFITITIARLYGGAIFRFIQNVIGTIPATIIVGGLVAFFGFRVIRARLAARRLKRVEQQN